MCIVGSFLVDNPWLWVIAQPLLLHNWIAGLGGLKLFLPIYLVRVPREEQMMIDQFGEAFRAYRQHTQAEFCHD
jgi:protein-S-isoprenylcysteine O-methyltransferase Ste14